MPRLRDLSRPLSALAALGLGLSGAPAAGQTSPAEGEALRAVFERFVRINLYEPIAQGVIDWSGEMTLRVEPGHYVLSTPPVRIGADPVHAIFPASSVSLVPLGDDHFRAVFDIPRTWEVHVQDLQGISAGAARIIGEGVIDLPNGVFLDLDIRATDILVSVPQAASGPGRLRIGELGYRQSSIEISPGRFDSAAAYTVDGLGFSLPEEGFSVSLAHFAYFATYRDLEPDQWPEFLLWLYEDVLYADPMPAVGEAVSDLLTRFRIFLDGGGGRYVLEDLTVVAPGGAGTLGRLEIASKVQGLRGDLADTHTTFAYTDLIVPPGNFFTRFIPTDMDISVAVDDLPVHELADMFFDLLLREPEPGGMVLDDPFAEVGDRILEALTAAGTRFHLDRIFVDGASFMLDASGTAWPDAGAALGARSELRFEIGGLEELAVLLSLAGDASTDAVRSLLFELGEPVTDASGRSTRRYELAVLADGSILLNGRNLAELFEEPGTVPH